MNIVVLVICHLIVLDLDECFPATNNFELDIVRMRKNIYILVLISSSVLASTKLTTKSHVRCLHAARHVHRWSITLIILTVCSRGAHRMTDKGDSKLKFCMAYSTKGSQTPRLVLLVLWTNYCKIIKMVFTMPMTFLEIYEEFVFEKL